MEKQLDNKSYMEADNLLTEAVADDLYNFLSAAKGRAYLMKHSVHDSDPIQKHLDEIIYCVDESIDSAYILSSFAMMNQD